MVADELPAQAEEGTPGWLGFGVLPYEFRGDAAELPRLRLARAHDRSRRSTAGSRPSRTRSAAQLRRGTSARLRRRDPRPAPAAAVRLVLGRRQTKPRSPSLLPDRAGRGRRDPGAARGAAVDESDPRATPADAVPLAARSARLPARRGRGGGRRASRARRPRRRRPLARRHRRCCSPSAPSRPPAAARSRARPHPGVRLQGLRRPTPTRSLERAAPADAGAALPRRPGSARCSTRGSRSAAGSRRRTEIVDALRRRAGRRPRGRADERAGGSPRCRRRSRRARGRGSSPSRSRPRSTCRSSAACSSASSTPSTATTAAIEIVDWKTGGAPRRAADLELKQLQLALYRVAYAESGGHRPGDDRRGLLLRGATTSSCGRSGSTARTSSRARWATVAGRGTGPVAREHRRRAVSSSIRSTSPTP